MKKRTILSGLVAGIMLSTAANAAVVVGEVTGGNSGGVFEEKVPTVGSPLTVGQDNQQSPNLIAINERQNVTLLSNIAGLTAGTVVNSHYVWFDPRVNSTVIGSVTFANRILAVLTTGNQLTNSDYLGNPNVTYLNPGARGLESNDRISFSGNTLNVEFLRASSPGDYVRVLTASAVPEPSTWMMLILGFGLIGAALRSEKSRRRTGVAVSYT